MKKNTDRNRASNQEDGSNQEGFSEESLIWSVPNKPSWFFGSLTSNQEGFFQESLILRVSNKPSWFFNTCRVPNKPSWFFKKKLIFLLCLFCIPAISFCQNLTAVNVVLRPPYSSSYSTFENLANHAIITLVNGSEKMDVVLYGSLASDQTDFYIQTRESYNSGSFKLQPNQTKVLINDVPSMLFLSRNNVDHSAISNELWQQILRDGQLPEGQYQFCVWGYPVTDDGQLIPREIGRACFSFSITQAQAPVITSPSNGQELNPKLPNTVFSWTPPIGNTLGAAIVYDLYVVKVPQGQDPNDAMNAAVNYKANNPIIKTNLTGNQYVTQPYDLKIDSNQLYAVQVVARDMNKQVGFKNRGRSEVVTFTRGKTKTQGFISGGQIETKKIENKPTFGGFDVTNVDPVPYSELKGKLYYRFKDALPSDKKNGNGKALNKPSSYTATGMNSSSLTGGDELTYNKEYTQLGDAKPLAGRRVSLVVTYLFSGSRKSTIQGDKNFNGEPLDKESKDLSPNVAPDADKVLATTITGSDGSFTFNFANVEKNLGLLNKDYQYASSGGEFNNSVNGKLYKVLRLRVEDKYYCSPDVNIRIDPWKGLDLGTLVSFVKSYTLKVKVSTTNAPFWDMAQGMGSPLPGITTKMIRKGNIPSVPVNEGEKTVIHESDKDGIVTFHHLVRHDPDNEYDRYFIKCVPDKKKGNFNFSGKEKKYYAYNDDIKDNFPFNSTGEYMTGDFVVPVTYGQDITWNHELKIETFKDSIGLIPGQPRIAGIVRVAGNIQAKALSNKKVVLMNTYKNSIDSHKFLTVVKTNSLGRYEFNNLPMEMDEFHAGKEVTKIIGPTRIMIAKPDGFKAIILPGKISGDSIWNENDPGAKIKCSPCYPPLKFGQQLLNQDFNLTPDGLLSGYVVDENGNAIPAVIDVDGLTKTTTHIEFTYDKKNSGSKPSGNINVMLPTGSKQSFSMAAPSGERKITITPNDKASYPPIETTLVIPKDRGKHSPIKFVVFRAQKRIRFKVAERPSNYKPYQLRLPGSTARAIAGATVTLNIPGKPLTQASDKDGYVTFIFDNSGADFEFKIMPPANADYAVGEYKITGVKNTLTTVTHGNAYLKKAATITGTVTIGPDKNPLKEANVYIELGGGKKLEAPTDENGKYVLKGVPNSPADKTVWAGKSGVSPNIISQNKKLTVAVGKKNELDFNLLNDNELLIENIYGFDVEIQGKIKQPDGTWLVSGNLINLPSNDNFSLQDDKQSIPFHDLKIKKSGETKNGIPVGVPVGNTMTTDLTNIKLLFQNSFGIIQYPSSGATLVIKANNQKGSLMGKMAIQKSTFHFTQEYVNFNDDPEEAMLLTEKPGSFNTDLPSIEAGKSSKKKFGLANLKGKSLSFKLQGFDANADAAGSWIQDNSINLQTIIHVKGLPGMSPSTLDINAGNLVIHPDKLEPLKGDKPLKFNLEKWQFVGNDWQLVQSNSSITMATGTIKTGTIDVPLSNISLEPNNLDIGNFDVKNLTLAGIIPVHVITTTPAFGYNRTIGKDQKAHYELQLMGEDGNPGVVIKDLPGMKPNDEMKFQNFSLISNGEQMINPGSQGNSTIFYNVMKVNPLAFTSGQDYVNMDCGIDLGIPQLEETSGVIQFSKEAGKLKLTLYPLNVLLHGAFGVDFSANVNFNEHPQNLTDGKFTAIGTIQDKEGISLKGVLNKTTKAAWIQVDPENQKLPLGAGSLADIKGKMEANMSTGEWNNFTFSGDMKGFKGMQGDTRKTFTVTGSINASNQKIDVKNIPSGFGNIGITYDIANSRFTGNLQFDKSIGPLALKGTASLLVDPGGWYFLAGGQLKTPGLGEFSAGLLIGNYNRMPGDVTQKLMQYAYDKSVPSSFQHGISGFFFTGMKDLPISIPNFSLNLVIIKVSFGVEAGLDARLWMGFDGSGAEFGIGAMAFAHAYLKGESILCTSFYADARAELGVKGMYNTGNGTFTLKGCGSFTISGGVQQCIQTFCCGCHVCAHISKSAGIKINLLLDSNGKTDMSFGFGNCSGQAPMTGNW